MDNYLGTLQDALVSGEKIYNSRTGKYCHSLIGLQLSYDMNDGFPLVTTRKVPFKSIVGELLGFFRGYTNAKDFRDLGCKFWDQNANETKAWLENPFRLGTDDLGRIYGAQWTSWKAPNIIADTVEKYTYLSKLGYTVMAEDNGMPVMTKFINQLEEALKTILTNPSDRRIIVTGWNPGEMPFQALPACHMDYRFVPIETKKVMHVVMTIRSWDLFLGAPANIASTALFLHIMCKLSGYTPGTVTIQATNAHIYEDHIEQVSEQIRRDPLPLPTINLDAIKECKSVDDVSGAFSSITPDQVVLENYYHREPLHGVMSA